MWKRIASISLTLVAVFSFVACAGAGLPASQEAVDATIEAMEDLGTYRFDLNTNLTVSGESDGDTFQMTLETIASGASDTVNIQMGMEMAMSADSPGQDQTENEISIEMYLIDGVMYMRLDSPEEGQSPWMKSEAPEQYTQTLTQIDSQRELLDTAQVTVVGSEEVGGVDCYILEFTPDLAQLWQWVAQQIGLAAAGDAPAIPEDSMADVFRSVSVKQWVAKDSYLLVRAVTELSLALTPELMGAPEEVGKATMDITMDLLLRDHNRPVSIVLPPEAEEAEETFFMFGFGALAGATFSTTEVRAELREPE